MTESFNWLGRCARAAAFGIAALLLLTIARIVFFFAYKNAQNLGPVGCITNRLLIS